MNSSKQPQTPGILDRSISRGKTEVNATTFAFLFSEMVQYSQSRVSSVTELHDKLTVLGERVGVRMVEVVFVRERKCVRESKLLNVLLLVKGALWKTLFGKEADKLDRSLDDESTYYLMEKEALVNRFISLPRDKANVNCAAFMAGCVQAFLQATGFPAKVTPAWHHGTTFIIKFEDGVIARDRALEGR